MPFCPSCGASYEMAIVACPHCREVLASEPPPLSVPTVVHRVPDAAAGALLCGVLEHHGIQAILKSATLPGYGTVRRDWSTIAWGEIVVAREAADEARAIIAEYLGGLEGGGVERRERGVEDVEPA